MAGVRGHRRIAARNPGTTLAGSPGRRPGHPGGQPVPPARRRLDHLRPAPRWLAAGRRPGLHHPLRVRNRRGDPGGHPAVPLLETVSGGMDSQYARRLPADLAAHDLADVRTEDRVHQVQGGSPPPERQAALHRGKVADRLLRRRHRGSASRHVSSSPGPRFHHLRPHERRILGTPGSLTLGNQADSRQLAQLGYPGAERAVSSQLGTTYRSAVSAVQRFKVRSLSASRRGQARRPADLARRLLVQPGQVGGGPGAAGSPRLRYLGQGEAWTVSLADLGAGPCS